jgi:hypothetical protein
VREVQGEGRGGEKDANERGKKDEKGEEGEMYEKGKNEQAD